MSQTGTEPPQTMRDTPAAASREVVAEPVPPARPRAGLFRTFVGIGIAMLLIGAAGLGLAQLHLFGDPRQVATEAELATLKSELQAVNARLAAIDQGSAAARPDASDVATRIQTLDSRLAALETQIARAADRDTLIALQDRLTRLEKDTAGTMLHRAATILAVANLARAAESGGSFDQELAALRTLAPEDPALVTLEPFTAGVPGPATVAVSFGDAARAALQADTGSRAGQNPIGRVWASLRGLVSVRRIGDVEGNTNSDRLARAQADLDRGDLSAAVTEASAVKGAAGASLAPWLARARARLTAERAITEMNRRVAQDLVLP